MGIQGLEVEQPGLLDRTLRLTLPKGPVDRIADQHLKAMDQLE